MATKNQTTPPAVPGTYPGPTEVFTDVKVEYAKPVQRKHRAMPSFDHLVQMAKTSPPPEKWYAETNVISD